VKIHQKILFHIHFVSFSKTQSRLFPQSQPLRLQVTGATKPGTGHKKVNLAHRKTPTGSGGASNPKIIQSVELYTFQVHDLHDFGQQCFHFVGSIYKLWTNLT